MMLTGDLMNELIGQCFETEKRIADNNVVIESSSSDDYYLSYLLLENNIQEERLKMLHNQIGFLIMEDARKNGQ